MYISRLCFHALPGQTAVLEQRLHHLVKMATNAGAGNARVLRTHFASDGAPDVLLEQEAESMSALEQQIAAVTDTEEFQEWSTGTSSLLTESPKREIYLVAEPTGDRD